MGPIIAAAIIAEVRRSRGIPEPPQEMGSHEGLAYARFSPTGTPRGSILIVHGAGSCKESHFDFARGARAAGYVAMTYDQRGHGSSVGPLGGQALDDLATMATLVDVRPLVLRGSSLGGYLALLGAGPLSAGAVVAICPASAEMLLRGLRAGDFEMDADRPALEGFLEGHDLDAAVTRLAAPLLLLHAEGDERVPVGHSAELLNRARSANKRLIALPGGHHRSVQHDGELHGVTLRFIDRALAGGSTAGGAPAGGY